jgi:quercetin 2,3-dioxygenase
MGNQLENKLPDKKIAYLLRNGEGDRYLFGRQLATIIANGTSTGDLVEIVSLSGGMGDSFPAHKHERSHEAIFVLHGKLELIISEQNYILTEGNYAYIPANTIHSYKMQSHRTKFLSITSKGEVASLYSAIGKPYNKYVHPPKPIDEISHEMFEEASLVADVKFLFDREVVGSPQMVDNGVISSDVSSYVLETGEGIRLVAAEQLFSLLTTQANTKGEFITVLTEGPKGDAIPEHYHEEHSEMFFCVEGQMTMWANGEEIVIREGDFLHVPANTVHSFRLDSHYTKFFGILTPGIFEPFFHTLCDLYDDHIFPSDPPPFRFDRVLKNIKNLDLKVKGGPPGNGHLPMGDKEIIDA